MQFFHVRKYNCESQELLAKGGETFALIVPPFVTGFTQITLGRAKCHPGDNYNKALGRTIATGRMQLVDATVIVRDNNSLSIFLDGGIIIKVRNNRIRAVIYS